MAEQKKKSQIYDLFKKQFKEVKEITSSNIYELISLFTLVIVTILILIYFYANLDDGQMKNFKIVIIIALIITVICNLILILRKYNINDKIANASSRVINLIKPDKYKSNLSDKAPYESD